MTPPAFVKCVFKGDPSLFGVQGHCFLDVHRVVGLQHRALPNCLARRRAHFCNCGSPLRVPHPHPDTSRGGGDSGCCPVCCASRARSRRPYPSSRLALRQWPRTTFPPRFCCPADAARGQVRGLGRFHIMGTPGTQLGTQSHTAASNGLSGAHL